MLINKDELTRMVLSGEISSMDDLNQALRSMIKEVVETAMSTKLTDFLGYEKISLLKPIKALRCLSAFPVLRSI